MRKLVAWLVLSGCNSSVGHAVPDGSHTFGGAGSIAGDPQDATFTAGPCQ